MLGHVEAAKEHGLGVSLIERLMNTELYQPNTTGNYNQKYIVKLIRNFRTNEDLLSIPSKLFYENDLVSCADSLYVNSLNNFSELTQDTPQKIPMLFVGILAKHQQENSGSLFNITEAVEVKKYVKKLIDEGEKPTDIGIITPYNAQVTMIKKLMIDTEGVLVGTVEKFQGREKKIIIISTVRSSPSCFYPASSYSTGFLTDKKRFNVAVTRCMAQGAWH